MSVTIQVEKGLIVTGTTKVIAVLGDPIEQVRSPGPLSRFLQENGFDAIQVPLHVRPMDLATVVDGLKLVGNLAGMVFTVPHKIAALSYADRLSRTAQMAGSINALRRDADGAWLGENFDGISFVRGLEADGVPPAGLRAMVVGCGGAGGAVCAALAAVGIGSLGVFDVDRSRSGAVARRLAAGFPGVPVQELAAPQAQVDLAVNCMALGMKPDDPLPFEPDDLPLGAVVAEVVMKPPVTRLLEVARGSGRRVVLGENLLYHQRPGMLTFFSAAATW